MKTASRTLVKSPPEVWEQLDQPARMEGLMSALVGHATEVKVTEREEESKLAWKAIPDDATIEVEIAEKGWGTNVSVSAENGQAPTKLEGWLDAVLDELATPTKRPFEGMTDTPSGTVADAMVARPSSPQPAPVQQAPVEETKAEKPPPPPPQEPQAQPDPAPEPPAKKRRRFFRFR
jgi:hypothetical protein